MVRVAQMKDIRLGIPTLVLLLSVVGAASFAAGRAVSTESAPPPAPAPASLAPAPAEPDTEDPNDLPPGHPPTSDMNGADLPAGHPPIGSMNEPFAAADPTAPEQGSLQFTAPPRWQLVPNASSMRLATYRVPRAAGDAADPELSITQAGGSVDANAERWIGQFGPAGQSSAKRTTRKVGPLEVVVVEVQGTYSGAMGEAGAAQSAWALLGAIVSTPGMPHFFKLTGPAKSVLAARGEFDAMIGTLVVR